MATFYDGSNNQSREVKLTFYAEEIRVLNEDVKIPIKDAQITFLTQEEISFYYLNYSLRITPDDLVFQDLYKVLERKKKNFLKLTSGLIASFLLVIGLFFLFINQVAQNIPDQYFSYFYSDDDIENLFGKKACFVGDRINTSTLESLKVKENYKIHIINHSMINAFAFPKDKIVFTTGLLKKIDDDEFFAVLGHEVGHHKFAHYKPAIVRGLFLQMLSSSISGSSKFTGLLGGLVNSKYSRDAERESDAHSAALMLEANKDIGANISVMKKLAEESPSLGYLSVLSSHPVSDERIKYFENLNKKNTLSLKNRIIVDSILSVCSK